MVKRLGNPESTTLLHSPCTLFQIPQVDGAIGYYQMGKHAIVIGDPICLPENVAELTQAFHFQCQKKHLKIIYLLAKEEFAHWAIKNECHTLIQIGSEFNINPTNLDIKHKLRWTINQSVQQGVQIKEYRNFDTALEEEMKNTIQTWLQQRRGPQIHLGNINFFNDRAQKRIFYAEHKEKIIGLLMLTPVDRFYGWVVNAHLATLKAPVGTTENLICFSCEVLAHENCHFLCLGIVSGTHLGEVVGLTAIGKIMANSIFRAAKRVFKLDAKRVYLKKYNPHQLRSTYLVCKDKLTISGLLAIKKVLHVNL